MRIRRYEKCVESGTNWLGSVAATWRLGRLGSHFDARRETVSDKDFPALSVTKNGIVPQLETAAKSDDGDNRKKVVAGDFVINGRSDRKGSSGLATQDGSVSLINLVLTPRDIDPAFVHHLFRSYPFQEEFYRFGKGIVADLWSTNFSEMKGITIPLPSAEEQAAIAQFLDRETARIDTLIARQQRLIELLQEKRQALITRAVTKGLDPDVSVMDSGVEWLGGIPAHWSVMRLATTCKLIQTGPFGSQLSADEYEIFGVPVVNPANIQDGSIVADEAVAVSYAKAESLNRHRLEVGDLVVGRRGEMGRVAVVDTGNVGWLCGTGCLRLVPSDHVMARWLALQIASDRVRAVLSRNSVGSTLENLNATILGRVSMVVPPLIEQAQVIAQLDLEVARLDCLIEKAGRSATLMKEHRSALIAAAVTGKIDVRQAA